MSAAFTAGSKFQNPCLLFSLRVQASTTTNCFHFKPAFTFYFFFCRGWAPMKHQHSLRQNSKRTKHLWTYLREPKQKVKAANVDFCRLGFEVKAAVLVVDGWFCGKKSRHGFGKFELAVKEQTWILSLEANSKSRNSMNPKSIRSESRHDFGDLHPQ